MKKKFNLFVLILFTFFIKGFAYTPWTGKYQLAFDANDKSIIYLQVVPDNTGNGDIVPGTVAYINFPVGTSYTATSIAGVWNVSTLANLTGSNCGMIIEAWMTAQYPSTSTQNSVVFTAGAPYNLIKFKLPSDCTPGAEYRMWENTVSTVPAGTTDPCSDWNNGGLDNGLAVESNSGAYTGNLTTWQNPIYCSAVRYWIGTTSTDFNTGSNWTMGTVPNSGDDVEFATVANNSGNPAVRDMMIPVGTEITIGNLTNFSDKATVIPSGTELIVNGLVTGSETDPTKIQIKANEDGTTPNGTLLLGGQPCDHEVKGTVQMFAKGFKGPKYTWVDNIVGSPTYGVTYSGYYKWQQFGVPVSSIQANPAFYGSYLREYSESSNNDTTYYKKWITLRNENVLTGNFKGYEITQDVPKIIELPGSLVFCDKTITLTRSAKEVTTSTDTDENNKRYGLGQNVFGNSFTAAIDISTLNFPANVEQTVYLYNTGSFGDWGNNTSELANTTKSAGSYRAIPYHVSSVIGDQIPSMQGFLLRHIGTFGTEITMDMPYSKLVKNVNPQSAPRSKVSGESTSNELSYLQIDLNSTSTRDKLWLFSKEGTTINFDNGWDGRKFFGTPTAYIYAPTTDGNMQISTNNNIIGSYINFIGNSETEYTLTLKKFNLDNTYSNLYLVDLMYNTVTPIDKDVVTYKFTANNNGTETQRFQIRGDINSDNLDSDIALNAFYYNNGIQILNNTQYSGVIQLFDVTGKMIVNTQLKPLANEPLAIKLITGVYFVKLSAGKYSNTVKIIIK